MHEYCRTLLKEITPDIQKYVSVKDRKMAYVMETSLGHKSFSFHISRLHNSFYWHGQACCKWHARYEGYCAYLKSIGAEGYNA